MIKIGLKPAMATSLAESDKPIEQLDTIIDFAKALLNELNGRNFLNGWNKLNPASSESPAGDCSVDGMPLYQRHLGGTTSGKPERD
jgi:hypothetical protein